MLHGYHLAKRLLFPSSEVQLSQERDTSYRNRFNHFLTSLCAPPHGGLEHGLRYEQPYIHDVFASEAGLKVRGRVGVSSSVLTHRYVSHC